MTSSDKRIMMAATAAAVAIGGFAIYYTIRGSKRSECDNENDDGDYPPPISKEEVVAIFNEITTKMSSVVLQLAKIEQKVRQEALDTGNDFPEHDLASYLMTQFEEAMKQVEKNVYDKHNCSEELMSIATDYFSEDPDVLAAVDKLKQLFGVVTGQPPNPVPVPDHVTIPKVLELMEKTMEAMNIAMEEACAEALSRSLKEGESSTDAMNRIYLEKAEKSTERIHSQMGLSREVLQSAVIKYQADESFIRRLNELQELQNARFLRATAVMNGQQ